MFRFIRADLRRHWIGALAILLIVGLATALGVAVTLQERALRLGSARAADAFDLVIGAPGSETQLVLSSVFLQPAPLTLMPGSILPKLLADPRVAWAAPVGFGDFHDGFPIVGTTEAMIDGLGGLAMGTPFQTFGDAIVGAGVPLAPGTDFHPIHGELEHSGEVHMGATYRVTGRLKPTGTPWDRAILVPIEAVWAVHEHEHEHEEASGAPHEEEHGGFDPSTPIDPNRLAAPDAPGLPAIIVKPVRIADAYTLRRDYRAGETLAVFPAEVLTRLYGTLGDARRVLSAIAIGAQALVAASILLVVTAHVLQRRRQIGALRAFGTPRGVIFAIVWLESLALLAGGLLLGFGIGYLAAELISAQLSARNGITLPVGFIASDALYFLALLLACGLAAIAPAQLAYRQTPAAALRS